MRTIKELKEIDFYVEPRPFTHEDEKAISEYIKADKQKRNKKAAKKGSGVRKKAA